MGIPTWTEEIWEVASLMYVKPVGVGFTLPTQRRGSPISPPQQSAYGFNRSIMANYLAHFQTIKNSCDRLVIAVEDVSDLWPAVKKGFEERLPFKRACLNNKTRNPVFVEKLAAEFILTTDPRLRSRFPQEQLLFWFREPYATVEKYLLLANECSVYL
ncbi:Trafficking protein particle complex II-specific subunit 130-like [Vitis vinifera]|uniref:Trafficking protein particle complex II-specific subunit 130-like n=1 Tax=Vitis vinifera TaxID=29760 RepID=A0A438I8U6_VITVI|nr:Trafficking protein particle complex II-specific subunit 130-like [Vitis vinifera]